MIAIRALILTAFLLSPPASAADLPYCPVFSGSCESATSEGKCTHQQGCSWTSGGCKSSCWQPNDTQTACNSRFSGGVCAWTGTSAQTGNCSTGNLSELLKRTCRPVPPGDVSLRFDPLIDGGGSCVLKIKTADIDPYTTDGIHMNVQITAPGGISQTFTEKPSKPAGSNAFEFHLRLTAEQLRTLRGAPKIPECKATLGYDLPHAFWKATSLSGIPMVRAGFEYMEGGDSKWLIKEMSCHCPDQFLSMLEGYRDGAIVSWYGLHKSANELTNVYDGAVNPSVIRNINSLPVRYLAPLPLAYASTDPRRVAYNLSPADSLGVFPSSTDPWLEVSPLSMPRAYLGSTTTTHDTGPDYIRACFRDRERITYTTNPTGRAIPGGRVKVFSPGFETELGIFEHKYTVEQVAETTELTNSNIRFTKSVIAALEANDFSATNPLQKVTSESLVAIQQLYQLYIVMFTVREQMDVNIGGTEQNLLAYLTNPDTTVIPEWKRKLYAAVCPAPHLCGVATSKVLAYQRMLAGLAQVSRQLTTTANQIKEQMPWLQGASSIVRDWAKTPRDTFPGRAEFAVMIQPEMLKLFKDNLKGLEKLKENLVKLNGNLTCPTASSSLSRRDFDGTMAALAELPDVPESSYDRCHRYPDGTFAFVGACKKIVGHDFSGGLTGQPYCYCEPGRPLVSPWPGVDPSYFTKREVSELEIAVRNFARHKIRSRRDAARLIDDVDGMVKSTAVTALATALAPGVGTVASRIAVSTLMRGAVTAARLKPVGSMIARFAPNAENAALWVKAGDITGQVMNGVMMGMDAAALFNSGLELWDVYFGKCDRVDFDVHPDEYAGCIRAAQWAVSNFYLSAVSLKFATSTLKSEFLRPTTAAAKRFVAEAEELALMLKRQAELKPFIDAGVPIVTGARHGIAFGARGKPGQFSGWGWYNYKLADGTPAVALEGYISIAAHDVAGLLKMARDPKMASLMPKIYGVDFNSGNPLLVMEALSKPLPSSRWSSLTAAQQTQLTRVMKPEQLAHMKKYDTLDLPGKVFESSYVFVGNDGLLKMAVNVRFGQPDHSMDAYAGQFFDFSM